MKSIKLGIPHEWVLKALSFIGGYKEFGETPVIKVCSHISVLAKETGSGNGEYQRELSIYCKECRKWYSYQIEIE